MENGIDKAFNEFWELCTHDFEFNELGKKDAYYLFERGFMSGAVFEQSQSKIVWELDKDKKLTIHYIEAGDKIKELEVKNVELEKNLELAVEALEFYADLNDEAIGYDIRGVTYARETLSAIKEA